MCLSPPRAAPRVLAVMCPAARAQVYGQLRRLVSSWRHPTRPELPLFYTVAYDFRRDFYEQAGALLVLQWLQRSAQHLCNLCCAPFAVGVPPISHA